MGDLGGLLGNYCRRLHLGESSGYRLIGIHGHRSGGGIVVGHIAGPIDKDPSGLRASGEGDFCSGLITLSRLGRAQAHRPAVSGISGHRESVSRQRHQSDIHRSCNSGSNHYVVDKSRCQVDPLRRINLHLMRACR
ncbi:MAG: hypothetical protein DDT30_01829 [Dehalococcoidia bacterium]|nr:hypothetical protein [Bacillota bacterium]